MYVGSDCLISQKDNVLIRRVRQNLQPYLFLSLFFFCLYLSLSHLSKFILYLISFLSKIKLLQFALMKPLYVSLLESQRHNSSFEGSIFVRQLLTYQLGDQEISFIVRTQIIWKNFLYDFCMTYWKNKKTDT